MANHDENEATEQLPPPSHEERITAFETGFAAQQSILNEINAKLDLLIKMQQEMYVDLRGRFVTMNNEITVLKNTVNQIQQDIQPDSFQNRLMRMGQ
ncbi:MAG: hypothetical protein ABI977_04370 [Acidobacteriota bacterium]